MNYNKMLLETAETHFIPITSNNFPDDTVKLGLTLLKFQTQLAELGITFKKERDSQVRGYSIYNDGSSIPNKTSLKEEKKPNMKKKPKNSMSLAQVMNEDDDSNMDETDLHENSLLENAIEFRKEVLTAENAKHIREVNEWKKENGIV